MLGAHETGMHLAAFLAERGLAAIMEYRRRAGVEPRAFHRGYKLRVLDDDRTLCFRVREFRDAKAASLRAQGRAIETWDGAGVGWADL